MLAQNIHIKKKQHLICELYTICFYILWPRALLGHWMNTMPS